MVCPICNSEYTSLNPCGCDTVGFAPLTEPEPPANGCGNNSEKKSSAMEPTGIRDPFWH